MTTFDRWKFTGKVYLWHYSQNARNFPGWHLTADAAGCQSLIELFKLLGTTSSPATRRISVTPPTREILSVPNSGILPWTAPDRLVLTFHSDPRAWQITEANQVAEFVFGHSWLSQLQAGISGIGQGQGDYSIGNPNVPSQRLWFWWQSSPLKNA
jgi:hypothetical protein